MGELHAGSRVWACARACGSTHGRQGWCGMPGLNGAWSLIIICDTAGTCCAFHKSCPAQYVNCMLQIAHQLRAVADHHRVFVLSSGLIAQQGPPHALVQEGLFKEMFSAAMRSTSC